MKIAFYYLIAYLPLAIAFAFTIRAQRVKDFRHDWRIALKDDPDALTLFAKRIPSFKRMLWSFKRLKSSNWIPSDVRAARHRAEMNPEDRKRLDKWIQDGGRV